MSALYQHIPILGPRSIRVLELQAAADPEAPISCRLRNISLDDFPEWHANYTALSYTWDGQNPSCEIDCDGANLLITPNCNAAIRQLRSATKVEILWIDSICIDQTPGAVGERNAQVALMGEIYKSAARVVVWLGPSNECVERALRQVMDIAMVTRSAPQSLANRRLIQGRLHDFTRTLSESVRSASEDPLSPLFDCSWFYRMWTVQEVTLSAFQRTFLRCGSLEIPWPVLIIALDAMRAVRYKWGRWEEATKLQKQLTIYMVARRFPGSKAIMDDNPGNVHNDPLAFDILTGTREKLAGNEKDKVIALYGLFAEMDIPMHKPDYNLSVEDIYRRATAAAIRFDKTLYILYHVPSDKRRKTLASWVPDWAERGFDRSDGRYGVLRSRFAASGPGLPMFQFSSNEEALILRGKIIDTVLFKAEPLPDMKAVISSVRRGHLTNDTQALYVRNIDDAVQKLKSWVEVSTWSDYPTGESSKDALQRTLVQDLPEGNGKYTADGSFAAWYDNMLVNDIELAGWGFNQLNLLPQEVDGKSTSNLSTSFRIFGRNPFHSFAMASNSLKCFFYTENRYFGTAPDPLPELMQAGDIIALISGLEMPLILRPVEGGYRLITHAYLHGVMHGELWPETDGELVDIALL